MQIDDYEQELMDAVAGLEDNLMEIEMLLQDALGEATGKFRDKVIALNSAMKSCNMDYIKFVLEQAETFHTSLKNHALLEQAQFEAEINEDNFEMPDENDKEFNARIEIMGSKEDCVTFLDQYKEYMDNQLGEIERKVNKAITEEWDIIDKETSSSQHTRNRGIVKEIIETCLQFKQELKEEFKELREQYDDQ